MKKWLKWLLIVLGILIVSLLIYVVLVYINKSKSFPRYNCEEDFYDCDDLVNQMEAQIIHDICMNYVGYDVHNLDSNGDGIACNEELAGFITCLPEQRNVDACIEIYQPVCATVNVQCITAPCDPVKETFENSCKACTNELVEGYVPGECP